MRICIALQLAIAFVLAGCAANIKSGRNVSTLSMLVADREHTKHQVPIHSTRPAQAIIDKLIAETSKCLEPVTKDSADASVPTYGISFTMHFTYDWRLEEVRTQEGHWLALRLEQRGWIPTNAVPIAIEFKPAADGGSDLMYYRGDIRKAKTIAQRIEDGTVFCNWRDVGYPFD